MFPSSKRWPCPVSRLLSVVLFYGLALPRSGTQDTLIHTLEGCDKHEAAVDELSEDISRWEKTVQPGSFVQPISRPVAGHSFFKDSTSQPQVRRHTPIFKNNCHGHSGSRVHQQTCTWHDCNAKNALLGCIYFPLCSTSSVSNVSDGANLLVDFVPRHLWKRWKNVAVLNRYFSKNRCCGGMHATQRNLKGPPRYRE